MYMLGIFKKCILSGLNLEHLCSSINIRSLVSSDVDDTALHMIAFTQGEEPLHQSPPAHPPTSESGAGGIKANSPLQPRNIKIHTATFQPFSSVSAGVWRVACPCCEASVFLGNPAPRPLGGGGSDTKRRSFPLCQLIETNPVLTPS